MWSNGRRKGEQIMYSAIKPCTQYIKEHPTDYMYIKNGRYYLHTHYAGTVEITENEYNRLVGSVEIKV